ncbi:MAG: hypothetical protein P8M22_11370 [Phycisphaerales bacterium]|nr:hypothetical protein [Phycisphaerales bacterium]
MSRVDPASPEERGLAPSATPSVVYGVLGVALAVVPVIGFMLGWLAFFRSQQAIVQMQKDERLEGQGLSRAGAILGMAALIIGAASTVIWLVILVASVPWS